MTSGNVRRPKSAGLKGLGRIQPSVFRRMSAGIPRKEALSLADRRSWTCRSKCSLAYFAHIPPYKALSPADIRSWTCPYECFGGLDKGLDVPRPAFLGDLKSGGLRVFGVLRRLGRRTPVHVRRLQSNAISRPD